MNEDLQRPLIPGLRAPLTPQQVFAILVGRWLWIAGTAAFFAVLGLTVALLMPQRYEATVSLLIDLPAEDLATGRAFHPSLAQSYLATRMDLLRSERVRIRAIRLLGLDEDRALRDSFRNAVDHDASFVRWLAIEMRENIDVSRGSESDLVRLTYTHESPGEAARFANALARAYMQEEVELISEPVQARRQRFEAHVDEMRRNMRDAEQRLAEAQRNLRVVDPDNPATLYNKRLEDLGARLNELRARRQATEASIVQLEGLRDGQRPLTDSEEFLGTRFADTVRERLSRIEAQRGEFGAVLGESHPRMVALDAERDALNDELREAVSERLESYRGELESLRRRERALTATLEGERSQAIAEQQRVIEIAPQQREADSTRRMYEMALQRYSDILRDSTQAPSPVRIVGEASPPQFAAGPRKAVVAIAGGLAGLFAGLMVAFFVELLDRRIRTEDDLERELDLPVLARLEALGR